MMPWKERVSWEMAIISSGALRIWSIMSDSALLAANAAPVTPTTLAIRPISAIFSVDALKFLPLD